MVDEGVEVLVLHGHLKVPERCGCCEVHSTDEGGLLAEAEPRLVLVPAPDEDLAGRVTDVLVPDEIAEGFHRGAFADESAVFLDEREVGEHVQARYAHFGGALCGVHGGLDADADHVFITRGL